MELIKYTFLGISAIVSIAIVTKLAGHPPRGLEQFILYSLPGGILMFVIFDPLLRAISNRKGEKPKTELESGAKADDAEEKTQAKISETGKPIAKEASEFPDRNFPQSVK